jgi:hypothetical protein
MPSARKLCGTSLAAGVQSRISFASEGSAHLTITS